MIVKVTHDGVDLEVGLNDYTAIDASDCRRATGRSVAQIMGSAGGGDLDLDVTATVLWLARRRNGEPDVSWTDVAATVSGKRPVRLDVVEEPDPEG